MAHLAPEVLHIRLKEAEQLVPTGERYIHYKHPYTPYRIIGHAITEADESVAIIYQQEGEKLTFVRPLVSFLENVEVDGKVVLRFQKLST